MAANEEELGPIDIVVIGYPADAPLTGEAAPYLLDLVDQGIIRVLDVLFVMEGEDGTFSGFEATDLSPREPRRLPRLRRRLDRDAGCGRRRHRRGHDRARDGGAVIMYENRWAAPFAAAVRRNGGVLLDNQRIPHDDSRRARRRRVVRLRNERT